MVWDRKHVEFIHVNDVPWQPLSVVGEGMSEGCEVRVLSIDPADGATTCILNVPAGWTHGEPFVTHAPEQIYVLSGDLHMGEITYTEGNYTYRPAEAAHNSMWSVFGCTALVMWDKRFEVRPGNGTTKGTIERLDTIKMHWQPTIAEGPQAGIMVKILRHLPETGEMTFITGILPYWREDRCEHHDCVEESFKLTGDMNLNLNLGDQMLMTENCYFYRPPYRKHGPLLTRTGTMSLIRVSSTLVNHYDPLPEEKASTIQKTSKI